MLVAGFFRQRIFGWHFLTVRRTLLIYWIQQRVASLLIESALLPSVISEVSGFMSSVEHSAQAADDQQPVARARSSSAVTETVTVKDERHASDALRALWTRRLIVGGAILIWGTILFFFFTTVSRIGAALTLLFAGALLAYLIYPIVVFLQKFIPRIIAIILVFVIILAALSLLGASVSRAVFDQINSLSQFVQWMQGHEGQRQIQGVLDNLNKVGVSKQQINSVSNQIFDQLQNFLTGLIPFWQGTFNILIDIIVVATLAVYFIQAGPTMIRWLRQQSSFSYQKQINFLIDEIDHAIGGYFRGLFIVGAIAGIVTGVFLWLLGVPYAVLLGLIVFVSNFIPVIGGYIGGPLCIIMAIPQGWVIVLIVALFTFFLQGVFLGQILSPRVLGKAVGIHPILAIFALFAGSELFGLVGGILAVPLVGVMQHIIVAAWKRRQGHQSAETIRELIS